MDFKLSKEILSMFVNTTTCHFMTYLADYTYLYNFCKEKYYILQLPPPLLGNDAINLSKAASVNE